MITTVLYDMDGLLLDTEPLWGISMLKIATQNNIPVSKDLFKATTGLRIYEVTEYWSRNFPWQGKHHREVADEILEDIIESSKRPNMVLPGVISSLELLKSKGIKIGLASSSPLHMIDALVDYHNLRPYFDEVSSADAVEMGKPHPGVFLYCAEKLGSNFHECLVLEDSINGMIAGKAARMKVAVVPEHTKRNDPRFKLADYCLDTLEDFTLDLLG